MNAKKCDRCMRYYDPYPIGDYAEEYNGVSQVRTSISDFGAPTISKHKLYDLCPDCMDGFLSWLRNPNIGKTKE